MNSERFMKFLFPGPSWRWDHFTDKYDNCSVGEGQWHMIKDKLILTAQDFIKNVFSYENIELTLPQKTKIKKDEFKSPYGHLESENGYCSYTFKVGFGESLYSFQVNNIPVSSDTEKIDAFFATVLKYLSIAYFSLESNLSYHKEGHLLASNDLMRLADSFVLNFTKTIMIEFLYTVLNVEKNMLGENAWNDYDTSRYNLELIEKAYVFACELSTRKIENKEIYTGFIFHNSPEELDSNCITSIKLDIPIEFGEFNKLKRLIPSTNGRNIFFNVTNCKVTHIFITRNEVLEISMEPIGNGKNFISRPLILSIQGAGKIFFIQGDINRNKHLFQIINSNPIIKDYSFIKKYILTFLSTNCNSNFDYTFFVQWILSIPVKKKGTTIIIGEFDKEELGNKLVSCVDVSTSQVIINDERSNKELLDHVINPDGALIFNKSGQLLFMSSILPFAHGKHVVGGGARHQSAINFTSKYHCVAITLSEDGNISIFNNGNVEIKF